ncbi:MAG: transposase, partial [Anaerolineaceae bacterium]
IMPNHIHMIVVLSRGEASDENDGIFPIASRSDASPLQSEGTKPRGTKSGSLGAIIQNFKSVSTRKINQDNNTPGECVWQRNYFEHIIRAERSLNAIRHYIKTNPIRWELDRYNPNAVGSDREAEALWYLLREKKMPAELERMMWQD